jgi:tRNA(Ile)-lysidine synthase
VEARRLGVPLVVSAVDVGTPSEAKARILRYLALERTARRIGSDTVLTAHTRDDHLETVVFRLLRGTGLRGVAGIPATRPARHGSDVRFVRPLLTVPHAALVAWLRARRIPWRHDETNLDRAFARTRIRRELLPALRLVGGDRLLGGLERLAAAAAALRDETDRGVAPFLDDVPGGGVRLERSRLRSAPSRLVRAALYEAVGRVGGAGRINRRHLARAAADVLRPGSGRTLQLPAGIRIVVGRREILVTSERSRSGALSPEMASARFAP